MRYALHRLLLLASLLIATPIAYALVPQSSSATSSQHLADTSARPVKSADMAYTLDDIADYNRYPTHQLYCQMLHLFAARQPQLFHVDTLGYSVEGRPLLCLALGDSLSRHRVMFSGTVHGDELPPMTLLLRLADSLTASYPTSPSVSRLIDTSFIVINPIANPDGVYRGGDSTVSRALRYNSHGIDLNRNFPDPFNLSEQKTIEPENTAIIDYITRHHFNLVASFHSGAEVVNLPWDSFTSSQRLHPAIDSWRTLAERFIATVRQHDDNRLRDISQSGWIIGGDWYVVHGGMQDYLLATHDIGALTIEISIAKQPVGAALQHYWHAYAQALINLLAEETIPSTITSITTPTSTTPHLSVYPNPTHGPLTVQRGQQQWHTDLSRLSAGLHIIRTPLGTVHVIKY